MLHPVIFKLDGRVIRKMVIHGVATLAVLMFALLAQAERAEHALLKVTIAVDGMMKSKSGAT